MGKFNLVEFQRLQHNGAFMKRDDELIRTILFLIEERGLGPNTEMPDFVVSGHDDRKLSYHVWLLFDGGYVDAIKTHGFDSESEVYELCVPCCLTFRGQEFLDSIRDTEIWRKTKEAAKNGGAASLELVSKVALAYLKKQIKEKAGVEIE